MAPKLCRNKLQQLVFGPVGRWGHVRLTVDFEVEVEAIGGRPVAGRVDPLLL